jgi:glycosyltransferase involved in cell wall biosynthesis
MASHLLILAQGIDGGIAPLASTLAHELKRQGWKCTVRYVGRPVPSKFVGIDRASGIDSEAIATGKARTLSEVIGLLRSIIPIWRITLKQRPTAIIVAGFIPALLYPALLRPFTKAMLVFWDHGPQNTFRKTKSFAFPLPLKCIDKIVSISPSTAFAMTEYFGVSPNKITTIPNGVEPTRWLNLPPAPDLSMLRIIMPARFDLNQKDQITLIKAAALLHRQGVPIEVTLLGSGVDEGRIVQVIKDEAAQDYVRLVAHSDDVPSFVAANNVLCLSTKFEGLPTSVIEGLLARRVVVAAKVAGCVDVIRDGINGFLFEAGSVENCAHKLSALQNMSEIPQIIEEAFQEAIALYTPQSMVTSFKRILPVNTNTLKA